MQNKKCTHHFRDFANGDYAEIVNFLNYHFSKLLYVNNPRDSFNYFMHIINMAIEMFVPIKTVKNFKNKFISAKCARIYAKMRRFYSKWLKTRDDSYLMAYKSCKCSYRKESKKHQINFQKSLVNTKDNNRFF